MSRAGAQFDVVVIGGGHAGAEAAWAASAMLEASGGRVALVTMDPSRTGAMSCNPAIGGLAKGQMVREVDALGGLMGLAADATGIQFKVLNASKGPAVRGPRCQSDKYAYAQEVQRLLGTRHRLVTLAGTVEALLVERGRVTGVVIHGDDPQAAVVTARGIEGRGGGEACDALGLDCCSEFEAPENDARPRRHIAGHVRTVLHASAVVLTTGTFMRALMHTGERKTPGGRVGEASAEGISDALRGLGLELGRLKTGTPPRLAAPTIDLASLEVQPGDAVPQPFSAMSAQGGWDSPVYAGVAARFPILPQVHCWITQTDRAIHDLIRANLHRAPMYNGQIDSSGPRYCPSIEDKVVRFADKASHHVFLEPESLRTEEVYCNGISTSLPADVQEEIVRRLPGCERARILRHGYAVEYDMVRPHQIDATGMVKSIEGLFLAGQINGTSGYEEAAAQGLVAGVNAARLSRGEPLVRLGRSQAYIGVLMDDLVTKTPLEPYRMFTSRAEHRLLLRADNADERLTPLGQELGLVDDARWAVYQRRRAAAAELRAYLAQQPFEGRRLLDWARQPTVGWEELMPRLSDSRLSEAARSEAVATGLLADLQYEGYVRRQAAEVERLASHESTPIPRELDPQRITGLRREAANALSRFRPATVGQAGRLEGLTPADVMLLVLALRSGTGQAN